MIFQKKTKTIYEKLKQRITVVLKHSCVSIGRIIVYLFIYFLCSNKIIEWKMFYSFLRETQQFECIFFVCLFNQWSLDIIESKCIACYVVAFVWRRRKKRKRKPKKILNKNDAFACCAENRQHKKETPVKRTHNCFMLFNYYYFS